MTKLMSVHPFNDASILLNSFLLLNRCQDATSNRKTQLILQFVLQGNCIKKLF